jgi:hypothetical protein
MPVTKVSFSRNERGATLLSWGCCWLVEELLPPRVPPEHVQVLRVEKGMDKGGIWLVGPTGGKVVFSHAS